MLSSARSDPSLRMSRPSWATWARATPTDGDTRKPSLYSRRALELADRGDLSQAGRAIALRNLAITLRALDRDIEAEPLLRRALARWENTQGPEHLALETTRGNLGEICARAERLAEAATLCRRVITLVENGRGPRDLVYI